jgi:citronellyl-CoA dehydrogenase
MSLFGHEHERFRTEVRAYIAAELTPRADEWEGARGFPRSVFPQLGARGYLGLTVDPCHAGRGLDFGYNVVLAEELPRSKMMGLTLSVLTQTNICIPLLAMVGNEEQKQRFLTPAVRGEMIGAFALTEPHSGSDLVRMVECTALDLGDSWEITGEKKFITNGPIADFVIVLARTKNERTVTSLSLIIVPTGTPGFQVKAVLEKLGIHSSPTGWLLFDRCRVPKRYTIGKPHLGFFYADRNLMIERLTGGVAAVAAADLAIRDTIEHLRERQAFGRPIIRLQAVRHRLSELSAQLEACRSLVYAVAERFRDGHIDPKRICMIKLYVYDTVQRVVEQCIQYQGGHGFLEESLIARLYRDVRVLTIGAGSSELMKDLIASYLRM